MDSDVLASRVRAEGQDSRAADGRLGSRVTSTRWSIVSGPAPRIRRSRNIFAKIASRGLRQRLHDQLEVECVPRHSGTHMRPSVRARLPPGAPRGQPVAICRLKRVAADHKHDIAALLPGAPVQRNGKRVACVGAGPASLTVARDLAAVGYEVVVFDSDARAGGMMRSQIPKFRLPDEVIDEEAGYALSTGGRFIAERRIDSLKRLLWAKATTPSSSAAARRAGATSIFLGAAKQRATSISGH